MSQQLDALKTQVERVNTVTGSVRTLVEGLAQQIRDNKDDPAALETLAGQLTADADSLTAVVTANTPQPPTPPGPQPGPQPATQATQAPKAPQSPKGHPKKT